MPSITATLEAMYTAFNARDIDGALARMSPDVDWPKASEGGRVIGKDAIRAYWGRQWAEFDPTVRPLEITERNPGIVEVKVHQNVKDRNGTLLFDGIVLHTYTFADGLIARMDLIETAPAFGTHAGEAA
jgi:hypothetical protein